MVAFWRDEGRYNQRVHAVARLRDLRRQGYQHVRIVDRSNHPGHGGGYYVVQIGSNNSRDLRYRDY